jgi:N-acetylmuramoyl-L-alanine amidase
MKDQKLSLLSSWSGVKRVVIDAARREGKGLSRWRPYEKDLNLQLARKLASQDPPELKIQAIMTRETDRFIPWRNERP